VERRQYRVGVPYIGAYRVIFSSDSAAYGGSNTHNEAIIFAEPTPWMGKPYSITVNLPALAGLIIKAGN
jgi:1,4-alpha-glucan branching enzyme